MSLAFETAQVLFREPKFQSPEDLKMACKRSICELIGDARAKALCLRQTEKQKEKKGKKQLCDRPFKHEGKEAKRLASEKPCPERNDKFTGSKTVIIYLLNVCTTSSLSALLPTHPYFNKSTWDLFCAYMLSLASKRAWAKNRGCQGPRGGEQQLWTSESWGGWDPKSCSDLQWIA